MIPKKDHYVDKNGKLTDDPSEYAAQVAAEGCFLDERTAKRYGITDILVPVDEPNSPRRVTNESSVRIRRIEEKVEKPQLEKETEPEAEKPEAAEAAEEAASLVVEKTKS
jgi:hypothetical protein